jgi:formate hydrogenlyase subunit 6/NADH:ubiquinone oxidoreductase subunit I
MSGDGNLYISCGVCVHKCPTQSIVLEHREKTTRPPKTAIDFAALLLADKQAAREIST